MRLGRRREAERELRAVRREDEVIGRRRAAAAAPLAQLERRGSRARAASSRPRSTTTSEPRPASPSHVEIPARFEHDGPLARCEVEARDRERVAAVVRRRVEAVAVGQPCRRPYSAAPSCGVMCSTSPLSTSRGRGPSRRRALPRRSATIQRPSGEIDVDADIAAELERSAPRPLASSRTTMSKSRPLRRFVVYASSAAVASTTCGVQWLKRGSTTSGSRRRSPQDVELRALVPALVDLEQDPAVGQESPSTGSAKSVSCSQLAAVRRHREQLPHAGQVGGDEQRRAVGRPRERLRLPAARAARDSDLGSGCRRARG